jgi:multimeric flavodoxin WrbA
MGKVDIKILGLSATPVLNGNCDTFVKEALKAAEAMSSDLGKVEIEFVTLADKDITMCKNCQWCIQNKKPCKIKDDATRYMKSWSRPMDISSARRHGG